MSQNLISHNLSHEQLNAILDTISTLKEQLHFLIDLDAKDKRNLVKMGDSSKVFVERALHMAQNHSDILPRRFDLEEYARDVSLAQKLRQIQNILSPLLDKLNDTTLAAGSDAYAQSLEVYTFAKVAGAGEGLDELRQAMSRRFSSRRPSPPTPALQEST